MEAMPGLANVELGVGHLGVLSSRSPKSRESTVDGSSSTARSSLDDSRRPINTMLIASSVRYPVGGTVPGICAAVLPERRRACATTASVLAVAA